jgi:polysaccharide pyruvyl transferase WcaK-like protein
MSKQVFIDHGEAYQNLGDEAMLIAAVNKFERLLNEPRILVPASETELLPEAVRPRVDVVPSMRSHFGRLSKIYNLQSKCNEYYPQFPDVASVFERGITCLGSTRFSPEMQKVVDAIHSSDIFYAAGGAYFNDFHPAGIGYKRWVYSKIPAQTASALSAQGIGPLENDWTRRATAEALKNLNVVTFRDYEYSDSVVEDILPSVERGVVADEAFAFPEASDEKVDSFLDKIGIGVDTDYLAFHYRQTDYTQSTSHLLPVISEVVKQLLEETSYEVVFVPMSYGSHSGRDYQFGKKIAELVGRDGFHVVPKSRNPGVIKGVVSQAAVAVGLSYHFHVFALSTSVPSLILYSGEYYKMKSEGLLGHYGLTENALDIERVGVKHIISRCRDLLERQEVRERVSSTNRELVELYDWTARRVIELSEFE